MTLVWQNARSAVYMVWVYGLRGENFLLRIDWDAETFIWSSKERYICIHIHIYMYYIHIYLHKHIIFIHSPSIKLYRDIHWIYVRMVILVVCSIYVPILVSVALIGSDTFEVRFLLLHHPLMGFKQCYILIIRTYGTNQSTQNKTTTILIIERGIVMHTTYFPPKQMIMIYNNNEIY